MGFVNQDEFQKHIHLSRGKRVKKASALGQLWAAEMSADLLSESTRALCEGLCHLTPDGLRN